MIKRYLELLHFNIFLIMNFIYFMLRASGNDTSRMTRGKSMYLYRTKGVSLESRDAIMKISARYREEKRANVEWDVCTWNRECCLLTFALCKQLEIRSTAHSLEYSLLRNNNGMMIDRLKCHKDDYPNSHFRYSTVKEVPFMIDVS